MTSTRANPVDGLLDVLHPDTNTWTRAIALLQVFGGLEVRLTAEQAVVLSQLGVDLSQLSTLTNYVQQLRDSTLSSQVVLSRLATEVQTGTNAGLLAINGSLGELELNAASLLTEFQAIRSLIANNLNYSAGRATTPTIQQKTLPLADTEYVVALPSNTKILNFVSRPDPTSGGTADVRYAFATNMVADPMGVSFAFLPAGTKYAEKNLNLNATLYVASSTAGTVIEVVAWS